MGGHRAAYIAEFTQCPGCAQIGRRRAEIEKNDAMQSLKGLQITLRRNPELTGEVTDNGGEV